jgi:hypothetical protein
MKWLLKIKKPNKNIERWSEILETVSKHVFEENGNYYLHLSELDSETQAQEAYDQSTAYLDKLNRALKFIGKKSDQLEFDGFYRVEKDESKVAQLFPNSIVSKNRISSVILESESREDRIRRRQCFFKLTLNDAKVADILELKDLNLTTLIMYNILEGIIKYDLGDGSWKDGYSKSKKLGLPFSKDEIETVKWSLQSKETVGTEARHFFAPNDHPKKELTIHQMRKMVRELIHKWLVYKNSNFNLTQ